MTMVLDGVDETILDFIQPNPYSQYAKATKTLEEFSKMSINDFNPNNEKLQAIISLFGIASREDLIRAMTKSHIDVTQDDINKFEVKKSSKVGVYNLYMLSKLIELINIKLNKACLQDLPKDTPVPEGARVLTLVQIPLHDKVGMGLAAFLRNRFVDNNSDLLFKQTIPYQERVIEAGLATSKDKVTASHTVADFNTASDCIVRAAKSIEGSIFSPMSKQDRHGVSVYSNGKRVRMASCTNQKFSMEFDGPTILKDSERVYPDEFRNSLIFNDYQHLFLSDRELWEHNLSCHMRDDPYAHNYFVINLDSSTLSVESILEETGISLLIDLPMKHWTKYSHDLFISTYNSLFTDKIVGDKVKRILQLLSTLTGVQYRVGKYKVFISSLVVDALNQLVANLPKEVLGNQLSSSPFTPSRSTLPSTPTAKENYNGGSNVLFDKLNSAKGKERVPTQGVEMKVFSTNNFILSSPSNDDDSTSDNHSINYNGGMEVPVSNLRDIDIPTQSNDINAGDDSNNNDHVRIQIEEFIPRLVDDPKYEDGAKFGGIWKEQLVCLIDLVERLIKGQIEEHIDELFLGIIIYIDRFLYSNLMWRKDYGVNILIPPIIKGLNDYILKFGYHHHNPVDGANVQQVEEPTIIRSGIRWYLLQYYDELNTDLEYASLMTTLTEWFSLVSKSDAFYLSILDPKYGQKGRSIRVLFNGLQRVAERTYSKPEYAEATRNLIKAVANMTSDLRITNLLVEGWVVNILNYLKLRLDKLIYALIFKLREDPVAQAGIIRIARNMSSNKILCHDLIKAGVVTKLVGSLPLGQEIVVQEFTGLIVGIKDSLQQDIQEQFRGVEDQMEGVGYIMLHMILTKDNEQERARLCVHLESLWKASTNVKYEVSVAKSRNILQKGVGYILGWYRALAVDSLAGGLNAATLVESILVDARAKSMITAKCKRAMKSLRIREEKTVLPQQAQQEQEQEQEQQQVQEQQ
ncbi:hypothetical protein SAMD00019534_079500 [Acytostelium subglobosum LB1]|uniref:hypothetical protein n=1 Tax=Acytostelium subglobosum LB1 TaxID=1410327 RepID=UPI0006447D4D|nr:hypothetical protein SAMD00019534_079500 [Acytostelium subglobosum LB1]GAM24775.1 hypothetical protein SAMD00019534_079500 [Acytostelium subglobosum LB1]|eukprot:XP_012752444.1 hypothetical protein SAMD00019534_079500 [Acytostelium subglobosum LB1]